MSDPAFLLACSLEDGSGIVHILVFRDDVGTWDVAYCGEGLGDYAPVKFESDGYPLALMCGRCFEAVGTHRSTLEVMA
jgi:hypothetical protein